MFKKTAIILLLILAAPTGLPGEAFAQQQTECPPECVTDTLEFTTYYPSPYGVYEELRGDKIIVGDTAIQTILESDPPPSNTITFKPMSSDPAGKIYEGSLYYNGDSHKFKYSPDGSTWKDLGGGGEYWKASEASGRSGSDIYYTWPGNVGIGVGKTDTVGSKVEVVAEDATKKTLILRAGSSGGMSGFSSSSPGTYSWSVPQGVSQVQIVVAGAKGGDGADLSPFGYPSSRGYGGNGGKAEVKVSVSQGATLYITIGNKGVNASPGKDGGRGGGHSSVLRSDGTVLVVGGGGGGGGGTWYYTESGFKRVFAGGSGGSGGPSGGTGGNGSGGYGGGNGGTGGTTSAGGVGGAQKTCSGSCVNSPGFCYTYSPGGTGGVLSGGSGGSGGIISNGGGGGSGYYGGGGGTAGTYANENGCSNNQNYGSSAGGGGGGANYMISSATVVANTGGANSGDGYVTITPVLGSSINNLTEWQDNSRAVLSVVDISGNLALGASTANGYKLYVNGSAYTTGSSWATSDLRFKENILPLNNSLDKILNIRPVSFDWDKDRFPDMNFDSGRQIGLVAQEVEQQIPELVHTDANGYKSISYDKLTVVTIEAVKEQQEEISELKELIRRQQEAARNQQKEIELLKAEKAVEKAR